MSTASLRYVDPDATPSDSYFFERRSEPRRKMNGHVTAMLEPDETNGALKRICALTLVDGSGNGIGATSEMAIEPGTRLTVFFPPHGTEAGFGMKGKAVNCRQEGSDWRVGIAMEETVGRLAG